MRHERRHRRISCASLGVVDMALSWAQQILAHPCFLASHSHPQTRVIHSSQVIPLRAHRCGLWSTWLTRRPDVQVVVVEPLQVTRCAHVNVLSLLLRALALRSRALHDNQEQSHDGANASSDAGSAVLVSTSVGNNSSISDWDILRNSYGGKLD